MFFIFKPSIKSFFSRFLPSCAINHLFVAEYPRCGGTWFCTMMANILRQGTDRPFVQPFNMYSAVLDIDIAGSIWSKQNMLENCGPEFVLKTHQYYSKYMGRAVCLFRRPADALRSYYLYLMHYTGNCIPPIDFVKNDALGCREYCRFYDSYMRKARPHSKIMFLEYDRLVHDTMAVLKDVNKLLIGNDLDEVFLNEVINESSLEKFINLEVCYRKYSKIGASCDTVISRRRGNFFGNRQNLHGWNEAEKYIDKYCNGIYEDMRSI